MGRSRGNFNADEDPSQRSRRKRNAAEGDHSESSVAGQVAPVGKKALYHCNYCNKDITGRLRIKCAVCPDFDLCVECFSVGAEVHPHKSNHPYRVIDNLSFPILCADWNAEEETLLLEGIDMYGMGNWAEIAEHVGTKVRDFCVQHYKTAYMDSTCFPLPDMAFCNGKNRAELLAMAKEHSDGLSSLGETSLKPESPFSSTGIKKEDSHKNGSSSRSHSNPNADNMSDRTTRDKNLKTSMELSGYNPKRHEFDVEYDNDAEQLLVDMEFKDTDTPEERETKLRILRIYNKRLDERQRRKDFIIKRNLLQPSPFEEGLSAEEKELCHRYDCFMRFHSREEHEKLLGTVVKEHRILKQINDIKEARAAGCRSPDEARRYLERKRRRDAEENGGSRSENAQPGSSSQRGFDITAYPESNLLTNYEKRVCYELRLTPPDYLRMQEVMSRLIFGGHISKKSDCYPVFINVEQIKVDWVYDMLVKKGIASP